MKITKEQIQQLTPEQQEMLAALQLRDFKARQRLVNQVGRYRGRSWVPALVMLVLYLVPLFFPGQKYGPLSIIVVAVSLWSLIQFHAAGVSRRLDALTELLEADKATVTPDQSQPVEG